jgi:hypothetical protein
MTRPSEGPSAGAATTSSMRDWADDPIERVRMMLTLSFHGVTKP